MLPFLIWHGVLTRVFGSRAHIHMFFGLLLRTYGSINPCTLYLLHVHVSSGVFHL